MSIFWRTIIKIRDIGYQWSVEQHGEERAQSDYKLKMMLFISGYYLTIFLILIQILDYFFDLPFPSIDRSSPKWMKAVMGAIMFGLPIWILGKYFLRKVEHVPIKEIESRKKFKKERAFYIICLFGGWFFVATLGLFLTIYLRGGEIQFFDFVWNKGGKSKFFRD